MAGYYKAKSYSMRGVQFAADQAVRMAVEYLQRTEPHSRVHDVQEDPRFQHRGVDLLWESAQGQVRGVEVKGDRQPRLRNYFFELISNLEKDTPGCFLYSQAEILLYVGLSAQQIHHLPLASARAWFLPIAQQFELRHTHTHTGPLRYTTVGALVPVSRVQKEVSGAHIVAP